MTPPDAPTPPEAPELATLPPALLILMDKADDWLEASKLANRDYATAQHGIAADLKRKAFVEFIHASVRENPKTLQTGLSLLRSLALHGPARASNHAAAGCTCRPVPPSPPPPEAPELDDAISRETLLSALDAMAEGPIAGLNFENIAALAAKYVRAHATLARRLQEAETLLREAYPHMADLLGDVCGSMCCGDEEGNPGGCWLDRARPYKPEEKPDA